MDRTLAAAGAKSALKSALNEYTEKYGEDNAQYLMEMEQGWMREYNCALYVDWDVVPNEKYLEYTKECAEYLGWKYKKERGSVSLVEDLFAGRWEAKDFLIVPPGKTIEPSYDDSILRVAD